MEKVKPTASYKIPIPNDYCVKCGAIRPYTGNRQCSECGANINWNVHRTATLEIGVSLTEDAAYRKLRDSITEDKSVDWDMPTEQREYRESLLFDKPFKLYVLSLRGWRR